MPCSRAIIISVYFMSAYVLHEQWWPFIHYLHKSLPCPKNQKGRKSGNYCQGSHIPTGCWHKRQVRSSVGIYRSRKLETNPLTNSDGLILGIINNLGSLTQRVWLICIVSPTLASFQFLNYPKILPTSGLWPFCFFCLDYPFPNLYMAASWSFMSQPKCSILRKAFPDPFM